MTTPTPDRLTAIEALSRAIDWIKPEVSMGGPRGGYVGPVTRQKAVDAIEQGIAALADRPEPGELDAALLAEAMRPVKRRTSFRDPRDPADFDRGFREEYGPPTPQEVVAAYHRLREAR